MPRAANDNRAAEAAADAGRARPCPICGKPPVDAFRPFCSKRCADVDLARWLGGRYAIPGEPVESEAEGDPSVRDDER